MTDTPAPLDRWQSLRDRLAAGPRDGDTVYRPDGSDDIAFWTLDGLRADYLQALLDERDQAVAAHASDTEQGREPADGDTPHASDALVRAADILDQLDQVATLAAQLLDRDTPISGTGIQDDLRALAHELARRPDTDQDLGAHCRWWANHQP